MKYWFVLAAWVCAATHAWAAPASSESIERLLVLTKAEKLMEGVQPQMMTAMKAATTQALKGKKLSADEQRIFDQFQGKIASLVASETNFEKFKPMFIEVYAASFSQEEVDGIIAFYSTPVGQAIITKMPLMMQSIMADMPNRMKPMLEKMDGMLKDMQSELAALPNKK